MHRNTVVMRSSRALVPLLILLVLPDFCLAELYRSEDCGVPLLSKTAQKVKSCSVGIRSIQGAKRKSGRVPLPPSLHDIKGQLTPLPFQEYSVIDSQQKTVACKDSGVFRVSGVGGGKHRISVHPHQIVKKKVHLTVDWKGPAGEKLVSTKMRVRNGKSVVLGTGSAGNKSTIVSIKLNCTTD